MMDVKALQARLGLAQDGVAGPATWGAAFYKCGAAADMAAELGLAAAVRFADYGISDSALRVAHFLAQAGHETDGWHAMEEYASGAAYEGRADLGNTKPGDGVLFKGRGAFQCTGRANYHSFGRALGIDLERHPTLAAIPSLGLWVACEFWKRKGLAPLADADDVVGMTRRVNGGTTGLEDREARLAKIKAWLL